MASRLVLVLCVGVIVMATAGVAGATNDHHNRKSNISAEMVLFSASCMLYTAGADPGFKRGVLYRNLG